MSLSGQQRKKLKDALIDAFRDKASLEQMLSYELNKNLNEIAPDGDLQNIVFKLIQKAEAEEWVENLVDAARMSNPGNKKLLTIESELKDEVNDEVNLDIVTESVSATVAQPKQEQQGIKGISNITVSLLQDDVITLECRGSSYTKFKWLSYNIKNGKITLDSNINAQTKWKVYTIGNGIVSLENLGVSNSLKWLAITQDSDVILASNTRDNCTYIDWKINILDDGTVALKNLQEIRYLSWLDGKTEDPSVGLAPNTGDSYTGTHWEIFKH